MEHEPESLHDGIQDILRMRPGGPPAEPDQTMTMGVANIGFMLERLGADCDDLQIAAREYLKYREATRAAEITAPPAPEPGPAAPAAS